jgi:hypothetical protein
VNNVAGGVAVHRFRVVTALRDFLGLRIEEFPFLVASLGIDIILNREGVGRERASLSRGGLRGRRGRAPA